MKRVLFGFGIVLAGITILLLMMRPSPLSLPPDLQATAASLLVSPQPPVDFIDFLYPYPGGTGQFSDAICVNITPERIYEPGDDKRGFDKIWPSLFTITYDTKSIPLTQVQLFIPLGCVGRVYGVKDSRCGVFGIHGCIGDVGITKGLHLMKLEAKSMSGKVYTYTWAFRADDLTTSWNPVATAQRADYDGIALGQDPYTGKKATRIAGFRRPTPTPNPLEP